MAHTYNFGFPHKLLKGVTIASGGVLPNIHPELLAKKRGSKGKLEAIITPPPAKKAKSPSQKKPVAKKTGGKKGARKSKVQDLAGMGLIRSQENPQPFSELIPGGGTD